MSIKKIVNSNEKNIFLLVKDFFEHINNKLHILDKYSVLNKSDMITFIEKKKPRPRSVSFKFIDIEEDIQNYKRYLLIMLDSFDKPSLVVKEIEKIAESDKLGDQILYMIKNDKPIDINELYDLFNIITQRKQVNNIPPWIETPNILISNDFEFIHNQTTSILINSELHGDFDKIIDIFSQFEMFKQLTWDGVKINISNDSMSHSSIVMDIDLNKAKDFLDSLDESMYEKLLHKSFGIYGPALDVFKVFKNDVLSNISLGDVLNLFQVERNQIKVTPYRKSGNKYSNDYEISIVRTAVGDVIKFITQSNDEQSLNRMVDDFHRIYNYSYNKNKEWQIELVVKHINLRAYTDNQPNKFTVGDYFLYNLLSNDNKQFYSLLSILLDKYNNVIINADMINHNLILRKDNKNAIFDIEMIGSENVDNDESLYRVLYKVIKHFMTNGNFIPGGRVINLYLNSIC